MILLRRGCRTHCICRRTSLRVWECGMNLSLQIALPLKLRAPTLPCAIATLPKLKNYTRSITWPTRICRRLAMPRRKRSSIVSRKCGRQIRNWNSAQLTRWPRFQHVMRLSGTIGRQRRPCKFRSCRIGIHFHLWKPSSSTVTRSDARTPATSMAHEKRSHECSNYATRRKIQSSIISKVISTCRCKRLRHAWRQLKARRTKQSICCGGPRIPKTYSASILFRPERSFRFANNSALCCWKRDYRRKRSENLKPRSRSTREDSEVYMERRKPPSKPATMRMQAVTTRSWPHKLQKRVVHE